jgi:hypothetical protein
MAPPIRQRWSRGNKKQGRAPVDGGGPGKGRVLSFSSARPWCLCNRLREKCASATHRGQGFPGGGVHTRHSRLSPWLVRAPDTTRYPAPSRQTVSVARLPSGGGPAQ